MEEEKQLRDWEMKDYEKIVFANKIGRGSQGSVFNGFNTQTGEKYAIKVMKTGCMSQKERQRLYQQIETNITISAECSFKFFPYFYGYWSTDTQTNLVFEKCQGNALQGIKFTRAPSRSYSFAYVLLYDILKGLQFLGTRNIIHRDLKPQNILLDKGMFKICDLGLSKVAKLGRRLTVDIGNIVSKSPEFYSGNYDCKTDIWALGINVFWIAFRSLPFPEDLKKLFMKSSITELFHKIKSIQFTINLGSIQTLLIQILKDMLQINKDERLSAQLLLKKHFPTVFELKDSFSHKKLLFTLYLTKRQSLGLYSNYYLIMLLLYSDFGKMDDLLKSKNEANEIKIEIVKRIKINIYLFVKLIVKDYDKNDEILEMIKYYKEIWYLELNQDKKNGCKIQKSLKDCSQALELHRSRVIGEKFPLMAEAVSIYLEMQKGKNVYLWELKSLDLRRLKI